MSELSGSDPPTRAPAGWYLDPSGVSQWRWWTGDRWSHHVAPLDVRIQSQHHPETVTTVQLQNAQARLDGFAAFAVWIIIIVSVISLAINLTDINYYRSLWHWWHELVHAVGQGRPVPRQPTRPIWRITLGYVTSAVLIVEIFLFIWQYRAASVARALHYPARHSPGWGVGCWFVPVVNFWMPYQAIRDCLPPNHPCRRNVLIAWVLFIASDVVFGFAVYVAFVVDPPFGVALTLVDIAMKIAVAVNACKVVQAIASDHEQAAAARTMVR